MARVAEASQFCPKCCGYTGGGFCSDCANLKAALLPPDSPNPSSVQKIRTWTFFVCPKHPQRPDFPRLLGNHICGVVIGTTCTERPEEIKVMPVEDHQRLLQAEVEKREEAESWNRENKAEARKAWDRVEAAESRLSSVVESLQVERDRMYERAAKATAKGLPNIASYLRGKRAAYRLALQLLRDKSTGQEAQR